MGGGFLHEAQRYTPVRCREGKQNLFIDISVFYFRQPNGFDEEACPMRKACERQGGERQGEYMPAPTAVEEVSHFLVWRMTRPPNHPCYEWSLGVVLTGLGSGVLFSFTISVAVAGLLFAATDASESQCENSCLP